MPHIDWTINLGNIITFSGVLIGLYIALSNRMRAMETKVDAIWDWFIAQVPTVEDGRRSADRFSALRTFDALRRKKD